MRFGDVLVSSAFLTPVTSPVLQIATFINYNISFVLTFILVVKLWRKPLYRNTKSGWVKLGAH
jgi:hypothetical protein